MTDINSTMMRTSMNELSGQVFKANEAAQDQDAPVNDPMTGDGGLDFTIIELLFFAYRDFTSDPDQILSQYGFGRAHHRVVHFVNRVPGLTVAELLDVLQITKQSLARVLKQLLDTGHIVQVQGRQDRRQSHSRARRIFQPYQ